MLTGRVQDVSIDASVLPQVTTVLASGSMGSPVNRDCLRASAARKLGAPQVTAYWCGPWRPARSAAASRAGGGSKSGKPWDKLIAPCALATRVMRRMTDSGNKLVRWLVCGIALV